MVILKIQVRKSPVIRDSNLRKLLTLLSHDLSIAALFKFGELKILWVYL